jgi:hypothetical protein
MAPRPTLAWNILSLEKYKNSPDLDVILKMPVQIVHLFRHAEAEHNCSNDISLRDSLLTAEG